MTLAKAGNTLKKFREHRNTGIPYNVWEAIDAVINILPVDVESKTAEERIKEMRKCLLDTINIDPFATKSRKITDVLYRNSIWKLLRSEGYTFSEIAKACGYNHSTVIFGINNISAYLDSNDYESKKVWNKVSQLFYH